MHKIWKSLSLLKAPDSVAFKALSNVRFSRWFRDPIRVHRIENRVPRIR